MRRLHLATTVFALLAACASDPVGPAPRPADASLGVIPGRFVVRMRDGQVRGVAALDAERLRDDPDVLDIEPDREIRGAGLQLDAGWGLDRVDQAALPLGGTYVYGTSGEGVTVFVFDTGINFAHADFGGRAEPGADFVTAGGADCNGHGSHVAGIVGGTTFGVAKSARLVSVRVLDCDMRGTVSGAVSALDWVVQQKRVHSTTPMVANLSLEGMSASTAFDQAVANAIAAGVTVVVAAGNSGGDACTTSPARAPGAIAVAASDVRDGFASFSSRGACVALAAPGVGITSAWIGDGAATHTASGTSQAAPFVAGAAALYLSLHPAATPAEVRAALVDNATAGALSGVPAGTPNRLLGVAFMAGDGLWDAGRLPTRPRGGEARPGGVGASVSSGA